MYFTVILISILTILFELYFGIAEYFLNKLHMFNITKGIPGPKAFPIIGNAHLFTGDTTALFKQMLNIGKNYQLLWRMWIGAKLFLIIENPEYVKTLLKSPYIIDKSKEYEKLKVSLGNGLLTAPDATLNTQLNSLTNPDCKLAESIKCAMDIVTQRIFKLWLHPNIIFYNTAVGKKFLACKAYLDNVTTKIIKEKMGSMLKSKINQELTTEKLGQKRKTIFDFLFEISNEEEGYTQEDIRDEINTIITAGSETTATTISFVLLMLASLPEIQDNVYEEVNRIYCSDDSKNVSMTYDDIKSMKLLERVIKETLRLFPIIPIIARKVTQDIKVTSNWTIPKGCSAVFFIYKIHRNAKYWPRPLVFDPDRFLPENNSSSYFFPFSYGKRNCIGQQFAMLEIITVIATLLKRFRVIIDKPIEIAEIDVKFSITLTPTKPIRLKFERRN
ncbi:cytochrome P450 4g15-like isoform X2 [Vespa mandarinia]|uniref:cytochrome P450 4g15-like isoform X2 n=1 Tax=Vespa mandarinia TaxID=7446 RepID=UPI00160B8665|nr:cytochrome P450 4g15-like isoform X2 [Vespa mandarinia]